MAQRPDDRSLAPTRAPCLAQLSPVADFVEVSKRQRAVGKLEKAATAAAAATATTGEAARAASWASALSTARAVVFAALVFAFRAHPVATVPPGWVAPLAWTLRLPGQPAGSIGAVAWLTACQIAVAPLLHGAARALRLEPPPKPAEGAARWVARLAGF